MFQYSRFEFWYPQNLQYTRMRQSNDAFGSSSVNFTDLRILEIGQHHSLQHF